MTCGFGFPFAHGDLRPRSQHSNRLLRREIHQMTSDDLDKLERLMLVRPVSKLFLLTKPVWRSLKEQCIRQMQ